MIVMLTASGCVGADSDNEVALSGDDTVLSGDDTEQPGDDAAQGDDIVLGVLVPTSGSEAYFGNDMLQAYELAVEEINAAGGVLGRNLRLFAADDGCDANMASQAAARIVSHGVDFVVGGYCSSATIVAMPRFYDANLIMLISASNSTEITNQGLNQSFMLNSPGTHAAVTLAELCHYLDVSSVALIHQGDSFTQNLSDLCEAILPQHGIDIATVQVMNRGATDVSPIVTAILQSGAEMVYWTGYYADGSNVIRQLRQGGFTGEIAVGDGSASRELITASGASGEGVFVTSPPFVEFAEGGDEFVANYYSKHGMEPGTFATLAYDTIYVLKQAIEESGTTDFETVRDAIQNIEYQGLSGLIKFNEDRELAVSNFIILQIENGEFNLITL